MIQEMEEIFNNWRGETGNIRAMSPETLKKLNKYLATEFEALWHNATTIFVTDEEDAALMVRRIGLTNGTVVKEGELSLREYNHYIGAFSFRDNPIIGPMLLQPNTAAEVVLSEEDEAS